MQIRVQLFNNLTALGITFAAEETLPFPWAVSDIGFIFPVYESNIYIEFIYIHTRIYLYIHFRYLYNICLYYLYNATPVVFPAQGPLQAHEILGIALNILPRQLHSLQPLNTTNIPHFPGSAAFCGCGPIKTAPDKGKASIMKSS